MSGEVSLSFSLPAVGAPLIAQDKLVGLATTGPQRLASLPSVPTLAEAGYPDVDIASCYGWFAAPGTPPDVIAAIDREAARVLADPEVRAKLEQLGTQPACLGAAAFSRRCGSSSRASHRSLPRSASRSSSARRFRRQPDPRAVAGPAVAGGAADAGPWVGLPSDGLQRPTEAGPAPGIRIGDRAGQALRCVAAKMAPEAWNSFGTLTDRSFDIKVTLIHRVVHKHPFEPVDHRRSRHCSAAPTTCISTLNIPSDGKDF